MYIVVNHVLRIERVPYVGTESLTSRTFILGDVLVDTKVKLNTNLVVLGETKYEYGCHGYKGKTKYRYGCHGYKGKTKENSRVTCDII